MIPEGYRLLTAEDVGKVFGIDLEVTVYVYFENDYVDFPSFWSSQKQLTDFITYNYAGYLGGAYISFDSGIISGADNLWLNATPPFEYCTITEGTELTTFNTDADWNTWLYVKDIEVADPYSIKIKNKEGIKLLTKDKTIEFTDDVKVTIDESLLGGGEAEPPYTLNLTLGGNNYNVVSYSIDGTNYINCTNDTPIYTIKNYGVIFIKKDGIMASSSVGTGLVVRYGASIKSANESVLVQSAKETTLSLTTQASSGGAT